MAITKGTIAASATPATDMYTQISTVLTNAGWYYIGQKSAATMGTTDIVKVWADPNYAVAASIYTGVILYIEVDDTNLRLRIRVSEKFDDSAAGAPATNVKWAAPGQAASGAALSLTPTANYAVDDNYIALFQATGTSQKVGWTEHSVSASGFGYWIGANADKFVMALNSGGIGRGTVAGNIEFLGTAGGSTAVFLWASIVDQSTTHASWSGGFSQTANNKSGGTARVSRDPLNTASTNQAFAYLLNSLIPSPSGNSGSNPSIFGSLTIDNQWFDGLILLPAGLHGTVSSGAATTPTTRNGAAMLSTLTDFAVHEYLTGGTLTTSPVVGDEVQVGNDTYVCIGHGVVNAPNLGGRNCNVFARSESF